MHIFIDTNIFETDPFWKGSFARILLERAKVKKLNIYISKVVYEELRKHTVRNYKKTHKVLEASINERNRYKVVDTPPAAKDDTTKEFDEFYSDLQKDYFITILDYKDISFKKVMDRLLKGEKPFTDDKNEVKDCAIWLTYAEYVENKKLTDCFLLTNNSKDFYHKEPISQEPTEYKIHDDLQKDSTRFRCFPTIKDFVRIVLEPQMQASSRFQKWLDSSKIDEQFILDKVHSIAADKIEGEVNKLVNRLEVDKVFNENEWFISGYCSVNEIEWYSCEEIEVDVLEDNCVVTAMINLRVSVEGQAYNPAYDETAEKFQYLGERELEISVYVSFILNEGGEVSSLGIDHIEISDY